MYLFLKQKIFTIRDKLTFFDANQQPVYTVKGSFFAIPHRLVISDAAGQELIMVKSKVFYILKTYKIIDMSSKAIIGKVKRRFSLEKNFNVTINDEKMKIDGSFFGFQFDIQSPNGETLVSVKKKILAWGDAYEIFIDETKIKPEIACAICVAFDNAVHGNKRNY